MPHADIGTSTFGLFKDDVDPAKEKSGGNPCLRIGFDFLLSKMIKVIARFLSPLSQLMEPDGSRKSRS